jgi:hypothetical protein
LGAGKTDANVIRHGVTGWDIFIRGAEDAWDEPGQTEAFREFPRMFDDLKDGGFDVIFLDFAQGATFIQKNAMVLKALINRVNAEKDATAKEENIIVGSSMGGQVARMALAQMERDNQNHCTRMYVSFDSPQKGAFVSKVQKNNADGITIYPNPTSDLFYLYLPKGSYEISVFDSQGRNIKQFRSENEENTI